MSIFTVKKLNSWRNDSWAVIDGKGTIVPMDGLTMKLTMSRGRYCGEIERRVGKALDI